ncbi:MAG: DMT family transporter [Rhodospirillaceae bacterium]
MSPTGAAAAASPWWRSPHAAAAFAMLLWAAGMVMGRWVHGVTPPLGLTFWRCFLGFLVLLPFAWGELRADWPILRRHWITFSLLGFFMFGGGTVAMFTGLHQTTAVNAGLINAIEPTAIMVFAVILFRDRVSLRQWAGVAISFAGVAILIARADIETLTAFRFNAGDLWVLGAVVSWALYANWIRKVPRGLGPLGAVLAMLATGAAMTFPLYVVESLSGWPMTLDVKTITTTLFLAVFGSAVSTMYWNRAVSALGPGRAGLYTNLLPVYIVALAIGFLGEALMAYHLVGIAVIGVGLYLAILAGRR